MSCAFTALQMEKHSPITLVHGIGLKCEQTSHTHAGRHTLTLYFCQYPAIIADSILSPHLSIPVRKKVFSCTYFFFARNHSLLLYIESVDGLKSQEAIYTVYFGFVSYMHCASSTPTPFLWMFCEFFTSFIGFSIQFLDTLRVHAFLSGKLTSDTLWTKCSRSFGTASKTGRTHCCWILL